jgi:hypothetical protein
MAHELKEVDLDFCGDIFDMYKNTMNDLSVKSDIVKAIFIEKEWNTPHSRGPFAIFAGSYMSYPDDDDRARALKKFYGKKIDAKTFRTVVSLLARSLRSALRKNPAYVAFIIGAVAKANDVSHHIGVIYSRRENIIKVFDPGMRSWGPESAQIVKSVIRTVFSGKDPEIIESYSGKWYCTKCIGPQDTCRGGAWDDFTTLVSQHRNTHRESYCQTWSIILILNELQQLYDGHNVFPTAKAAEWAQLTKRELEICIRRFILWIVWKYPLDFQNTYKWSDGKGNVEGNYKKILLLCMKNFDRRIKVPKAGSTMCRDISLQTDSVAKGPLPPQGI